MATFNFWRINDEAWDGCEEVCESTAKLALGSFLKVDDHYTYTAANNDVDDEDITPEDLQNGQIDSEETRGVRDEDTEGERDSKDDVGPHFSAIL